MSGAETVAARRVPGGHVRGERRIAYALKKNVAGCELQGVRACCAFTCRDGMLPIRLLAIRTPRAAGD